MSVNAFREELQEQLSALLWRQWSRLGISGSVETPESNLVIDPEALLLFSASFGRYDARLYDLLPAWLGRYGALLNPVRMKNLLAQNPHADKSSLAYLLSFVSAREKRRWARITAVCQDSPTEPTPLFLSAETGEGVLVACEDEQALQFGLQRAPYRRSSKKITLELPGGAPTLVLRLRALLGVGAKAELLLWLQQLWGARGQELSDASGYGWSTVQEALEELQRGGFVRRRGEPRKRQYLPASENAILNLRAEGDFVLMDWASLYRAADAIRTALSNPVLAKLSETTQRGEMERLWHEELEPMSIRQAALCRTAAPAWRNPVEWVNWLGTL